MKDIEEQIRIIAKGADEVIDIEDLREKLLKAKSEGTQLTVKLGLDPSVPDIHIGHAVVLRKMKQIQDLGHKSIIIIGDFTGMIGDPTGKSKTRKQLTKEQVLINAKTYEEQILKILDPKKTEIRFNSEWLEKLNFADVIALCSKYSVARMLERDDFKNRFNQHETISIHEFFYPLMQAYDSVELKADIEIGGSDQRFNILLGRTLQKDYGQEPQVSLFMPLLEGIDGNEKMSKSLGNYIGINEDPKDMFVKVMQIPDNLILKFFELATDIHPDEIDKIKIELNKAEINPRDIKIRLAKEIIQLYHGIQEALEAEKYFINVFQKNQVPEEIREFAIKSGEPIELIKILTASEITPSLNESKRLIMQGGVRVNGEKIMNVKFSEFNDGDIIKVGKRNFIKIRIN